MLRLGSRRERMGPLTMRHLPRLVGVLHREHGKLSEDAKEGGKEGSESPTKLRCLRQWRMGRRSRRTGKPCTRGICPMAKAPSLRKDRTKGTQRTRELSTGKAPWSWRNGKERFVHARRGTAGAKPYTMKVVRTVFNGGHEETYGNATRLVPTQRNPDPDIPCLRCQRESRHVNHRWTQ